MRPAVHLATFLAWREVTEKAAFVALKVQVPSNFQVQGLGIQGLGFRVGALGFRVGASDL